MANHKRRGRPPWVPTVDQNRAIIQLQKATSDYEYAWNAKEEAIEIAIELGIPDVHVATAARTTRLTIAKRRREAS